MRGRFGRDATRLGRKVEKQPPREPHRLLPICSGEGESDDDSNDDEPEELPTTPEGVDNLDQPNDDDDQLGVSTDSDIPTSDAYKRWRATELCIWLGAVYSIYNDVKHGAIYESPTSFKDAIKHIIGDMKTGKPAKIKPRKKRRKKREGDG